MTLKGVHLRGVFTDQINMDALTRPSFIDSFYDEFNDHQMDASSPEMADALVKTSIWDRWATPDFDRLLSYHFLDEVSPTHPLIDGLIDDWRPLFNEISSSTELILRLHQLFLPMVDTSSLHTRTLLNIEVSMIIRMAELHGVSIPDVHSYDAMDVFQQNHFGLCWPTSDGWLSVPFGGEGVVPLTFDQFLSMELIGRNSCMVHPNGVRSLQPLQVVDAMNQQVIDMIRDLFPSFDGLGVQDVIQRVRNHMQSYDYIADHEHEWQSLDVIFSQQGGDCEDLAHLEASLLIRALEDAGFSDVSNSIEFMTGLVGEGMTQFGHTVIHLNFNGQTFVIDSTLSDGMISRDVYDAVYGFKGVMAYSTTSNDADIATAMAIDTSGDLDSYQVTTLRNDFLTALGMTDYYNKFNDYYPTVTDTSQNTAFWAATSSGSGEAQQAMADSGATKPDFESIDFDEEVYVGESLRYYDTNSGVAGLMERIDHRVDEMSVNLTNQTMNKYVGQTYNGYFIYDYSRIMSDYTNILNLIQMVTGYLTAITTYCNAFNWIASQLSYDNEPNSEIKARQRLVKSVQGVLLKMVDEVEYFIPLFTQTYDDLNQATYSKYKDEVTMEFQNIGSNLADVFGLGSETIRQNKMREKIEAEYWYVAVKNRELLMQSTVTAPHSRALMQFLNFTDPYSNILGAEPGSARGFANFHNNMELDILAGIYKPIQVTVDGAMKTLYISALHYYLPWYFNAEDIVAYKDALGTDQDTSFSVSDVDMFAYNSLRDVFEPTGLNAMKNESGFFVREPWLTNLNITAGRDLDATNFKSTRLYKFLYANAFKFNAMFEIEAYKDGYDTNYYAGSGKFFDDPQSMVQMMERKRRLSPLEFADILDIDIDKTSNSYGGSVGANTEVKTSEEVWGALKDAGYINQYGLFNKTMADQLFNSGLTIDTLFGPIDLESDVFVRDGLIDANKSQAIWDRLISQDVLADNGDLTITQLNDDDAINQWFDNGESENVKNHVLTILRTKFIDLELPSDAGLRKKIAQRIYEIFSVDDYQFSEVQYNFSSRPQLFVRAHPNLISNGYVDIFGNESFSRDRPASFDAEWGYKFLNDQFSSGESEASANANEASQSFIDGAVDSAAAPAPVFTDSYLTNWGIFDSSSVNIHGSAYSVSEVRTYLYNHLSVSDGRDFFSNVVLTAAEQKAFYDQYIIAEDDVRPSKYASSSGKTFSVWSLPDFIENPPQEGTTQTYSLGGSSAPLSSNATVVLPSSSPSYSYDYGAMEKLPFDTRIVSESTESLYSTQGGKVIGTIQYVDYEDRDVDTGIISNLDKVKVYESDFAQETITKLNDIRAFNSLEKPLTPVQSYNDESVVFSAQDIQTYTGLTRNSDEFNAFMGGLIASRYAKPVFQRIKDTSGGADSSNVGKYQLMGYTFLSTFFSGTPTVPIPGKSTDQVTTIINNLSDHLKVKYEDEWRLNTKLDMFKYFYQGNDFRTSGFLDRDEQQYQLLRWVGEDVGVPIHGLNEATPFMSYDWHMMKSAQNGMMSTQSRVRVFYFVIQAYISSYQTIANKLDNLAYKGTGSIEADLQMFEKRVGKQIELFAQINAKNNALVQINNSYYKQKIETIKASDLGIRIAKGIELYGGLTASVVYLVAQGIRAAAAGAGPAAPAILATAEVVEKVSAGIMIVAGAATVTQRAIALAHEYGIPQKMTADLFAKELNTNLNLEDLKNQARTDFKNITGYKSPVTFDNGGKWNSGSSSLYSSNGTDDQKLEEVYTHYSPYVNSEYTYAHEGGGRDVWQSVDELLISKSGDCEDYAVLAASSLVKSGVDESKLRIVNGILGYGGHAPVSHTVVLYDSTGEFQLDDGPVSGKKQFSSNQIQVIDLVAPRQSDGSNFSYDDYQNQYGFFQPVYSYDAPGASSANLDYGFQNFEVFGYNPSAAFAPPTTPKGPLDLGPYSDGFDPPYFYKIEQNSSRRSNLLIYSDSGATNLVDTQTLPKKIEYGQKTLQLTTPSGVSAELTLHGNFDTNSPYTQGGSLQNLKDQAKDEASSSGVSIDESAIDVGAARGTSSDQPVTYQSNALILRGVSGGAGGGVNNSDLVIPAMKNLLLLEMEEHAILQEMHELALKPIEFSTHNKGYKAYDWPTFQHLQRRIFLIQQKMKKSFLVMKLKAEFLSLIGTRLGEFERQQMSGTLDSIFQSHFSKMSHSVEAVQLVMQSMESIHQSNYEVDNQREKKIWGLAFTTLVEGIMAGVTMISITGPPTASVVKPILNVLFKFVEFFGNLRNPFYLKSAEQVRNSTKMVNSNHELNALKELFNIKDADNQYVNVQNTIYDETGKVPYNADVLGNPGAFKTQNEIFQDPDIEYSLTINDVVNEYWNVNNKGYNSPTISDIYKGQIQYADGPKTIHEFSNESLEDYVMRRMSSRYFSDSGDDLMFLNGYIYSMSGTKLFLDEDFFDWIQQRLSAEMMNQIFFSMYISSIRSFTSNLGYSGTGGNDAIQTASSLTSEIGNHYFQIQTTLGAWESLQLSINELRFGQFKLLDRLILEGIISIATAAVSVGSAALGKLAATGASKLATIAKVCLQTLSAVALTASEMTSQLTDIIYNAVDASEENRVMNGVKSSQVDLDADPELQEKEGDTAAQRAEKQLRRERKSVGEESLKTAGDTKTGFVSTYLDQSKKVKMKRQVQELSKMMEVSIKVNESRSEFIKSLASNLGYSTAQHNVSASLSSIQGMAKQAADKAVDARFTILEASAKRANSISSAMRNMIMAVATVAASVFLNQLFKGANKKMGAASKNKRSFLMSENMKKLAKSVLNLAITAGISGAASEELKSAREENEAENKAGQSEMSQSVGDAASSDRGQQLSGLERRAINAQMNSGMTQESEAINKVITEMYDKLGPAIMETLKAMMEVLKDAVDKKAKAMKPKGSNAVADVDADYQKELKEAGGDKEKVNAAKSQRNERMKGVIDNLKGDQHKNIKEGKFGGEIHSKKMDKKAGRDGTKKVESKTDAQLDKEFDDLTNDMMAFAEKEGKSSDNLKGKSYNELEKLASNPDVSPKDRKAARNAMISKAVPSLKILGKAKGMMKGGILSKMGGALLALVGLAAVTLNVAFLKMIREAFKNVPGGETDSERAESIKGAAVSMAFANERGRGMGDEPADAATKKRRDLMAKNPGIVREALARQSSRESRLSVTSRMPAGTAGKALQDMMSSNDPSMSGLAAQIVADSPGSVKANMENAMDAFKGDNGKLLDFMDKVSATGPAGEKIARQMIDSVNGRSGVLSELTGSGLDSGSDAAAKGMSQRMQQMLSTPSSAKRIAAIRAKGLSDDERVGHKFLNGSNGMVTQLKQLKNQIKEGKGSTAKTERGPGKESDVAQSMIQLFSEGDSATDQMTLDALNSREKGAITDVLKGLMAGSSVKGGQRAGHHVDLVREELIKASADASPVKQQRIKALAKRLNIDMTGAPGEKDAGIKNTADKESKLSELLQNPGDTGSATRMEASLEALAGTGKGKAAEQVNKNINEFQKEIDASDKKIKANDALMNENSDLIQQLEEQLIKANDALMNKNSDLIQQLDEKLRNSTGEGFWGGFDFVSFFENFHKSLAEPTAPEESFSREQIKSALDDSSTPKETFEKMKQQLHKENTALGDKNTQFENFHKSPAEPTAPEESFSREQIKSALDDPSTPKETFEKMKQQLDKENTALGDKNTQLNRDKDNMHDVIDDMRKFFSGPEDHLQGDSKQNGGDGQVPDGKGAPSVQGTKQGELGEQKALQAQDEATKDEHDIKKQERDKNMPGSLVGQGGDNPSGSSIAVSGKSGAGDSSSGLDGGASGGAGSSSPSVSQAGQQSPTPTRQQEAAAAAVAQQGGGASHVAATVSSDGQSSGGESAPVTVISSGTGTGGSPTSTVSAGSVSSAAQGSPSPTDSGRLGEGPRSPGKATAPGQTLTGPPTLPQVVSGTEPDVTTPPTLPQVVSGTEPDVTTPPTPPQVVSSIDPDATTGDTSNRSKAAALMLSNIAEHAGLFAEKSRQPVDEQLVRKDGQIQIDQPGEVVRKIIEAVNDSTNSAGAAGYVKDFLLAVGVQVDDPGVIKTVVQNPQVLFRLTSEQKENVKDFLMPVESKTHNTTDQHNNVKPQEKEYIKRFVQVTMRAAGVEMAMPVKPQQVDPSAQIGDTKTDGKGLTAVSGPGNVPQDPNAGSQPPSDSGAPPSSVIDSSVATPLTRPGESTSANADNTANQQQQGMSAGDQTIAAQQSVEGASNTLATANTTLDAAKTALRDANSELGTARETVAHAQTAVGTAQTTLDGLTKRKAEIDSQIANLRAQDESLSEADAQALKAYNLEKAELEKAIGQAEAQLQSANTEGSSLQLEFNTADAALNKHQATIAQKQFELDQKQTALTSEKPIELLKTESGTLQRSIDQTTTEVKQLTARQAGLKDTSEKQTSDSQELTRTISELEVKLGKLDTKIQKNVENIQTVADDYMSYEGDGPFANLTTRLGEFFGWSEFGFRLMQRLDGQKLDGIKSQINAETLEDLQAEIRERGLSEADAMDSTPRMSLGEVSAHKSLMDRDAKITRLTTEITYIQKRLGITPEYYDQVLGLYNVSGLGASIDRNVITSLASSIQGRLLLPKSDRNTPKIQEAEKALRNCTLNGQPVTAQNLIQFLEPMRRDINGILTLLKNQSELNGLVPLTEEESQQLSDNQEKYDATMANLDSKYHKALLELTNSVSNFLDHQKSQRDLTVIRDANQALLDQNDSLLAITTRELADTNATLSSQRSVLSGINDQKAAVDTQLKEKTELKADIKQLEEALGKLKDQTDGLTTERDNLGVQLQTNRDKATVLQTTLDQLRRKDDALVEPESHETSPELAGLMADQANLEAQIGTAQDELKRAQIALGTAETKRDEAQAKVIAASDVQRSAEEGVATARVQLSAPQAVTSLGKAAKAPKTGQTLTQMAQSLITDLEQTKLDAQTDILAGTLGIESGKQSQRSEILRSAVEQMGAKISDDVASSNMDDDNFKAAMMMMLDAGVPEKAVFSVFDNIQEAAGDPMDIQQQMAAERPEAHRLFRLLLEDAGTREPSKEVVQSPEGSLPSHGEAFGYFVSQNPSFMPDVGVLAKEGIKLPLEGLKQTAGMAMFGISDQMELAACRDGVLGVLSHPQHATMDDLNVAVQDLKTLCRSERNELNSKIPSGDAEMDQAIRHNIRTLTEAIDGIETFQAMDRPTELDAKIAIATVLSNADAGLLEEDKDAYGTFGKLPNQLGGLAKDIGQSINNELNAYNATPEKFGENVSKRVNQMRGTHKPLMRSMAALAKTSPDFFTDATGENVREGQMFQLINDQWSSLSKADQANMASQLMTRVGASSARVLAPSEPSLGASTVELSEKCLDAIGDQLVQLVADGHMGLSQLNGAIKQLGGEKGASFRDQIATIESSDSKLTPEQKSQFKAALALATIMSGDATEMGGIPQELTAIELATTIQYVPNDRLAAFYNNSAVADGIHHQLEISDDDVQQQSNLSRQISETRDRIMAERNEKLEGLEGVKNSVKRAMTKRDYSKQLSAQLAPLEQQLENLEKGKPFLNDVLARQISDNPDLGAALFSHLGAESSTSTTGSTRVGAEMAGALDVADGPGVRQASATSPGVVAPPSGLEPGSGFRHLFESLPSHVQRDTMGQLTDSELGAFLEQTKNDEGKVSIDVLSAMADSNPTVLNQLVENDPSLMNQLTEFLKTSEGYDGAVQVIQSLSVKNAGQCAKIDALKDAIKTHHPVGYMGSVLADVRKSPGLDVVLDAYGLTNDQIEACPLGERLTLLTNAFESLGRAGNQNPELMSQLLSELTVENMGTEGSTRLANMFSGALAENQPSDLLPLIKDAMVGAMFKDNSLNVCLTLDHLPQNIQDQLTSLSKNNALRDAFQEGFNEYDQTRFDGLKFGLSAASLTSHNAHELVASKKIIKDADSFEAEIKQFEKEIKIRENNVLIDSRKVKVYKDSELKGATGKVRQSLRRGLSSDPKYVVLQQNEKESKQQLLNIKTKMAEFMVHSLTSFDPTVASSEDVQDLAHLVEVLNTLAQDHEDQADYFQSLKTLACARGYALTESNVQATSSVISPDGGDALSTTADVLSSVIAPSGGSPQLLDAANAFKQGLGVQEGQSFKEQATIINQKIDEAGVFVLRMRSVIESKHSSAFLYGNALLSGLSLGLLGKSTNIKTVAGSTTATPIADLFRSNDSIVRSSRDVKRHRFTTLKSQVNMVNEKTQMDVNQFMAKDTPFSNEVEAALFLDQVMAQHSPGNESSMIYSSGELDMSKLTQTFARFNQVQAQFPQLRTESVKAFEKQMAEKAISGDKMHFDNLFKNASVGAQQQLMATMGASDPDGANGLKDRAQALKAKSFASLAMEKLHAPSAGFVQSSDIDHAQQTMMRHVGEALATLPTENLKKAYLNQLTQEVKDDRLLFNQTPAKNSVMLARLRGIQQAAQKDGLNTKVFDTSVSKLLGSMSVDQLPLSNRSMDHMLTFMIGRRNEDNGPMLEKLLMNSPKDFDRLQARASIHSNGSAVTKAMSDIRSQQYRSGENIPSFVVTRESSNISKMSYTKAVHEGIELANKEELSDTAKGEILAQLMIDSPTNFLAVMEGLQSKHGKDDMTPEDRMVASGMHRIANDPGLYQLFTNIQHGNFDSGGSRSGMLDYIDLMMDKGQYLTESGISTLTRGHMDGSNAGLLTRGIVGAAATPFFILSKGIYQAGKSSLQAGKSSLQAGEFSLRKVTRRPKPLKIRGAGSRQRIMRQVVQHLADHSSSMGTVNTMLIGQGVNRHRDTINLMTSIGPERMATMVEEGCLDKDAMKSMSMSMAALSIYNDKLLLPFKPFSPNEIYDGSDISTAIKTLKSALTTAAKMGEHVQEPGVSVISTQLTSKQDYGMKLLTSALAVSPKDLRIHEDDSKHPEVQEFMDRMAGHAFDAMRHDPDQMAQILNAMFDKSPRMKGVALAALPRGDNSGLLDSLSRLEDTPQKPALQAMACLIRPWDAQARDLMTGSSGIRFNAGGSGIRFHSEGSGIRFNVDAAAQYLSSATENDQQVATEFVRAMNYAIDHGLVSNTELHELYQKTDMDRLIGHCLVLKGDDPPKDEASTRVGRELSAVAGSSKQRTNDDLMKLMPKMMGSVAKRKMSLKDRFIFNKTLTKYIPKLMGSVAKYGKNPMDDLNDVFTKINKTVAGIMPGGVESPSGSDGAPDSDKDIHDLKTNIVRQMQNHMVVDGAEFQDFVRSADKRATFTDAFGQALEARIHRFSETDSLSPIDEKLGAMYRRLEEFQKHPNNIKVRKPGELYGTQPAHEPTVRDLFASHELDPQDVQHLLAPTNEDRQPGTSFSKTFNTMLNTRIRDVVYYNSPHHQLVRTKLNECRQMVHQGQAPFYRGVQEVMAQHVGARTSGG